MDLASWVLPERNRKVAELRGGVGAGRRQSRRSCYQFVGNTQSQTGSLWLCFVRGAVMWWTCAVVYRQLKAEEWEGGIAVHLHERTVVAAAGESSGQQDE